MKDRICELECNIDDMTGYKFLPSEDNEYPHLTSEDKAILDAVIQRFGRLSRSEIVNIMHKEDAYIETAPNDIIQFKYTKTLSL